MADLDNTIGLLRDANDLLADLEDSPTPTVATQRAAALALVAIGVNLERVADNPEALVESTTDVVAIKEALQTLAARRGAS